MVDVATDGAAEIEPVAAPTREVPPGQARAHHLRELRGGLMGLRDLIGITQPSEIDVGEIVGARGAFHAALAGAAFRHIIGRRQLVGDRLIATLLCRRVLHVLQRRIVGAGRRTDGTGARAHTLAQPERIEQTVELVPVGFARREQMFECRAQQARFRPVT